MQLEGTPEQQLKQLLRIANPTELLRAPVPETINYGFLHSTDTQKVLFLTPSFRTNLTKLLSKTPPLFADAFRLANSKAAFPNIKDAVNNFGEAIALITDPNGNAQFADSGLYRWRKDGARVDGHSKSGGGWIQTRQAKPG